MSPAPDGINRMACDDEHAVIVVNHPEYLEDFIRLNEAWINRYFSLEAADMALARNPAAVIDQGGYIFTLLLQETVAGVCALFRDAAGGYQLARMAVAPQYQGRGFGDALIRAAIDKLRSLKADKVTLLTNSQLQAAVGLYRKHGFQVVQEGGHPEYARVDMVMEKYL